MLEREDVKRLEYQVNVYLTANERAEFAIYSRRFLLDAAGLLALLFAREMRVGRLGDLIPKDAPPVGSRAPKITARVDETEHVAVTNLAARYSKSLSQIGSVLVRAELAERWLDRAMPTLFESPDHG